MCLCVRACYGHLPRQHVNSMNWIMRLGEGLIGVCLWYGAPMMHIMSSLNLSWH